MSVANEDAVLPAISVGANTHTLDRSCGRQIYDARLTTRRRPRTPKRRASSIVTKTIITRRIDNAAGSAYRVRRRSNQNQAPHSVAGPRVILAGETDLEFDDSQTARLKRGDALVVRVTAHGWVSREPDPALVMFVIIDAKPLLVGGRGSPDVLARPRCLASQARPRSRSNVSGTRQPHFDSFSIPELRMFGCSLLDGREDQVIYDVVEKPASADPDSAYARHQEMLRKTGAATFGRFQKLPADKISP